MSTQRICFIVFLPMLYFSMMAHSDEVVTRDSIAELGASLDEALESDRLDEVVSSYELEPSSGELEQILNRNAYQFGEAVDRSLISEDEMDPGPAYGNIPDAPEFMMHPMGYMRNGMQSQLPIGIVANSHVAALYRQHAGLRQADGMELPSTFSPLVNFIEGYIRENARAGAEERNGLDHRRLALQVVRASFCFGTDPLMVISKMRRETHFSRLDVSSGEAVGWSQMTGPGIREVQHQMSGNSQISVENAQSTFRQAIRCFTGLENFSVPMDDSEVVKGKLRQFWALDLIFGQIMMKTLVSYVRANGGFADSIAGNVGAYREAFVHYNGDNSSTRGVCLQQRSVLMRNEYACDVISHFNRMNAQWNRFIMRSSGRDRT